MNLVIVPEAVADLRDAAAFYAKQGNTELALQFMDEFERVANLISSAPQLGAVFRGNRRRYFLRKFPYSVIYQIAPTALRIIALAHQRRSPAFWTGRK